MCHPPQLGEGEEPNTGVKRHLALSSIGVPSSSQTHKYQRRTLVTQHGAQGYNGNGLELRVEVEADYKEKSS